MELPDCLEHIRKSHICVATNDLENAKRQCLEAIKTLANLLKQKNHPQLQVIKALATYTGNYYEELLRKKEKVFSFTEKVIHLSSTQHGHFWNPVIKLGEYSSLDIEPTKITEHTIKTPNLGENLKIEMQPAQLDWSVTGIHDLYQDLLPNCSFVLSLLLIAEMGMELHLRSLVRHFDNGKIKVQLHFNGLWREIALNLDLPFVLAPHSNRSIFVRSSSNPELFWPAFLEKAFLVGSGMDYLFSGSNMANDTYMLTGWFPEVMRISNISLEDIGKLWKSKRNGEVMLGIGTGKISDELAERLGVISEHDYVVSGYDEEQKILMLKNPWKSSKLPEKRFLEVNVDLIQQFKFLYVNRKPEFSQVANVAIVNPKNGENSRYIGLNPQFDFTNNTGTDQKVAVVAEQFVMNNPKTEFQVDIYENNQGKLFVSDQVECVSLIVTNSRFSHVEVTMKPNCTYTAVFRCNSESQVKFFLSVHHNMSNLQLTKTKLRYLNSLLFNGQWGKHYGGGHWGLETFISNPQYDVSIREKSDLLVVLKSSWDQNVNFHMVHIENDQIGKPLRNFDQSRLLFDENYTKEVMVKNLQDVEPGNYRLIVSNYETNQSEFSLELFWNTNYVEIEPVHVSLGLFIQNSEFQWVDANRQKLSIWTERHGTEVTCKFNPTEKSDNPLAYRPAIRASVFDSETCEPIVVNTNWNDLVYGVFLEFTMEKAKHPYTILIERFERGTGLCRFQIGSSARVEWEKQPE